jgi:hypothetical protein
MGQGPSGIEVTGPGGETYVIAEGTRIQDAHTFAGAGTKVPLNDGVADGLSNAYGGKPEDWQHRKGVATIDDNGELAKAEIHWFQNKAVGKRKTMLKRWLE